MLIPGPAVAALILLEGDRYLLQLRDDIPDIWYPNHWGLFGGSIDPGESPEQALAREVQEEIGLAPDKMRYFSRFDFDFSFAGRDIFPRYFYEVPFSENDIDDMVLGEGADMKAFSAKELFQLPLVPYDAFALLMHTRRTDFLPS